MTNEMTHDDIINKEIEEEHEFMRARIKELENKPTYPFNEAFNKQLQEENAFLKNTINHFAEIFGIEKTSYTTNKDFADFIGKVENKLQAKEQECKNYKEKVEYIHAFLRNPHNYGSFRPMWGAFLLHWLFNENLGDFFPEKAYEMADTIEEKEKQIIKYKQALDEIEKICQIKEENSQFVLPSVWQQILNIINKAKGQ